MNDHIEVRFARVSDERAIQTFLHDHWRSDHIFVTNPELLRWQHAAVNSAEQALTFLLACRVSDGEQPDILGLLGFIPFRRFDPSADWTELALAIWRVREAAGVPGLGLELLNTLKQKLRPALICAIGTSKMVRPIYTALGYKTGALSHAALFPTEPTISSVALGVPGAARLMVPEHSEVTFHHLNNPESPGPFSPAEIDNLARQNLPRKSWNYIVNRFLAHPFYSYQVRAISTEGALRAILVWRKVDSPRGSVLRIVDIVGDADAIALCGAKLRLEIEDSGCEYMDLLHWGVSHEALAAGGFVSLEDYPEMILPNYFEPFEQRNVQIHIAFWTEPAFASGKLRLFRADSDQDRPNLPESLQPTRKTV